MKRNTLWLLLIFLWLNGCSIAQGDRKERPKIDAYFDLKGLIDRQVQDLSAENPGIRKEAVIDGEREVLELDSVDWAKELNMFAESDINKPRLLAQYETTTFTDDAGNEVTRYQNVDENISGVYKMEVVKNLDNEAISSLFVENREFNTLFTSEIRLEMNFDGRAEDPRLKKYSISGFEKVILKDTMRYSIDVQVGLDI